MSPKSKQELARQHLQTAEDDLAGERYGDALNAMFHAAEAAAVWLAEKHGIDTQQKHWLKADAAAELHQRGVVSQDFSGLLRQLIQDRNDYWYEGDEPDPDELASYLNEVEALVATTEGDARG